jgi:hypothetical protein
MNKKSGGPVSAAGKAISSKNAIKHGATSTGFINDQEEVRYNSLLNDLKAHYKFDNPLIKLQLERIAKVTVQLERIQNIIDATFQKSRAQSRIKSNLMDELKIGSGQRLSILLNGVLGRNQDESSENNALDESIVLRLVDCRNPAELLKHLPTTCREIFIAANSKSLSLKEYIDEKICESNGSNNQNMKLVVNFIDPHKDKVTYTPPSLEESFLALDEDTVSGLIKWQIKERNEALEEEIKLKDFNRLLPIAEQATTPDLDHLDKLMRYQTTLQRQISTTIGELIALTKTNSM